MVVSYIKYSKYIITIKTLWFKIPENGFSQLCKFKFNNFDVVSDSKFNYVFRVFCIKLLVFYLRNISLFLNLLSM